MNSDTTKEKRFRIVGVLLVTIGILLNQWMVGYIFRPAGMYRPISGFSNQLVIWSFQVLSVGLGCFFIWRRKTLSTRKLVGYYKGFSAAVFTTIFVFVVWNVILYVAKIVNLSLAGRNNPVSEKYGITIRDVYPGLNDFEIRNLLTETWQRPFLFEPYTQFKERPFAGKYVNVDAAGFRHVKNQEPWPPQDGKTTIFIFGGSTAFGYGVSDYETSASYLQEFLRDSKKDIAVYNFARGHYYSTQERVLYEKLLSQGFVPDVAVFIDGINELRTPEDEPKFTAEIAKFFNSQTPARFFSDLPLVRFIESFGPKDEAAGGSVEKGAAKSAELVARYLSNKRLIEAVSNDFDVKTVFVWQPSPVYKYDSEYNLFRSPLQEQSIMAAGYPYVAEYVQENNLGKNFLYLADIQEPLKKPLYVDAIHYSAELSREIARHISDFLVNGEINGL